jgi:hypothetical protein
MSMNNLAPVLRDQGKYKQAEEMHQQALELKETLLGRECSEIKDQPGVLLCVHWLRLAVLMFVVCGDWLMVSRLFTWEDGLAC